MSHPSPVLAELSSGLIRTEFGEFRMSVFHDGKEQAIALTKGEVPGDEPLFCRIHSECISAHVFYSVECDCREQMARAQRLIESKGRGIILFLEQEGRGSGAAAHVAILDLKRQGVPQSEAYRLRGFPEDRRRYDMAAKVLRHLGVESVNLISGNEGKKRSLEQAGIRVARWRDAVGAVTVLGSKARNLAELVDAGAYRFLDRAAHPRWILVVGDLNVDYTVRAERIHWETYGNTLDRSPAVAGGTGFNAALAFRARGLEPIAFGKIGDDTEGRLLSDVLAMERITALLGVSSDVTTGTSHIIFFEQEKIRIMIKDEHGNANDYDLDDLRQALLLASIGERDLVFIAGHALTRRGPEHVGEMLSIVRETGAKVIFDVVPHDVYERISGPEFRDAVGGKVDLLVGELRTLAPLAGIGARERPDLETCREMLRAFGCTMLDVRFGEGNIAEQLVCSLDDDDSLTVLKEGRTGYECLAAGERRGFGDSLTAEVVALAFGNPASAAPL